MAQCDPLDETVRFDARVTGIAADGAERPVPECIFGLFDMLGIISEWSGERYGDRAGDRADDKACVWMAGSGTYRATARILHTFTPDYALQRTEFNSYGFRIARTHPAKSPAVNRVQP